MSRLHRGLAATAVCALSAAALAVAPSAASAAEPGIRINEVESSGGVPGDWIEFRNTTAEPISLDGYVVTDSDDSHTFTFPAGTVVAPGALLVIDEGEGRADAFDFGLGGEDRVRLFDPAGVLVDERAWTAHGNPTWGVTDAGEWAQTNAATKGAANTFPAPAEPEPEPEPSEPQPEPHPAGSILLNEIDSAPADWVELFNPGTEALDISGYEVRDNSDDHRWAFPADTSIAAGARVVVDADTIGLIGGAATLFGSAIGIGSADRIRLFDPSGALLDDSGAWEGHAALDGSEASATLARCPDGLGAFVLAHPTPGHPNECVLPAVEINEIESNGDTTDWVEIVNTGSTPVDISGWTLMDNDPVGHADETTPLSAGTTLAPGEYFVFDGGEHFVFGLGGGDTATVRDAHGATVAEHVYPDHAGGVWGRCADGTGEFVDLAVSTKGLRNACGTPIRINEVESDGGSPDDWIELVNPTDAALDVSGIVVTDDDPSHRHVIPAGTTIPANGYFVIARDELGFGLGGGDAVRVLDGDLVVDETAWGDDHAATTWGRCPDTTGAFAVTEEPTPGAANVCAGELPVGPWPGGGDVTPLDEVPTFLEDSSGLDVQKTADGAFLWAVDNGTGTFWKLAIGAGGSVSFADGWAHGKRARFIQDAANPAADGPDAEGITVAGDGFLYVASERDNSDKGVNRNVVLQIDPDAAGPDVVATREWDLTAQLPAVEANLGLEAIEWIADDDLAGKLFATETGKLYDPADYPGHGRGLFFVAAEDTGDVYAFALSPGGSATKVATIDPSMTGVMALDYDSVLGVLWAVCDNGCDGEAAQITLTGTAEPAVAHVARPAGMPNVNNEGFATAPASLAADGSRPAWWFEDGVGSGALRLGSLPAATDPGEPDAPGQPGGPGVPPGPGTGLPGTGGFTPLPATSLVDGNRGGITVPGAAAPGTTIRVSAGTARAGTPVSVWLYSTPVQIATGTLDAAGSILVTIPADAALGTHRIAVYALGGQLLGWDDIRITASGLAATGGSGIEGASLVGMLMLAVGAASVLVRRRRDRTT